MLLFVLIAPSGFFFMLLLSTAPFERWALGPARSSDEGPLSTAADVRSRPAA